MALVAKAHGGGCCGMVHIMGFFQFDLENKKEQLDEIVEKYKKLSYHNDRCILLEAVVTDLQIKVNPGILKELKKHRFRKVSTFRNKNSGNFCYVYHKRTPVKDPFSS